MVPRIRVCSARHSAALRFKEGGVDSTVKLIEVHSVDSFLNAPMLALELKDLLIVERLLVPVAFPEGVGDPSQNFFIAPLLDLSDQQAAAMPACDKTTNGDGVCKGDARWLGRPRRSFSVDKNLSQIPETGSVLVLVFASIFPKPTVHTNSLIHKYCFHALSLAREYSKH